MDENPKSSARKLRAKHQRDRRKSQEKQCEASIPVTAAGSVTNSQPQRANIRQRNEAVVKPTNNVNCLNPPSETDSKAPTEKENVTIDFSTLKRETEEISKLTKKFAKRNISSNWHRYSAPEGPKDNGNEEEEAPADFSALIQVPSSRGGHLQLKDEQEWSSAAKEQLGGCFALNLKQLTQSLACIPLYEQLRLPKHMFTEEELHHFDSLASSARKDYNPDAIEDANELVLKTLTNVLNESEEQDSQKSKATHDLNVSNVDESNLKLTNINLQSRLLSEISIVDSNNSTENHRVPFKDDVSISNIVNKDSSVCDDKNTDYMSQAEISSNSLPSLSKNTDNHITETRKNPSEDIIEHRHAYKNKVSSAAIEGSPTIRSEELLTLQTNKIISENISPVQPKEKRTRNKRESNVKEKVGNTLNSVQTSLKIEDDDDLDFLLSLRKPAAPENNKSVPKTDSNVKPGRVMAPQGSSQPTTELDDWLDSVLQD